MEFPLHISRNSRSTFRPKEPTFAEIALPEGGADFTHYCLSQDHIREGQDIPKNVEDIYKLKDKLGGTIVHMSGQEVHQRCKATGATDLGPVGAQFSKTYTFLLFNM